MELLQDGAGIYVLSPQSPTGSFEDGLEISGTFIHDVVRTEESKRTWPPGKRSPVTGIYCDSGVAWTTIRDNVLRVVGADRRGLEGDVPGIFLQPGHPWLRDSPPTGQIRIERNGTDNDEVIAGAGPAPPYGERLTSAP
jgi:hypothetical protein